MAPPIVTQQPGVIYGTPPVLPVYSMTAVENNVLADELQDYDRYVPMWHDPFEQALMNQGGLLGLDADTGPAVWSSNMKMWRLINKAIKKGVLVERKDLYVPGGPAMFQAVVNPAFGTADVILPFREAHRWLQSKLNWKLRGLDEYPGPNTPRFYMTGLGALKVELPEFRSRGMAGLGGNKTLDDYVVDAATMMAESQMTGEALYGLVSGNTVKGTRSGQTTLAREAAWNALNRAKAANDALAITLFGCSYPGSLMTIDGQMKSDIDAGMADNAVWADRVRRRLGLVLMINAQATAYKAPASRQAVRGLGAIAASVQDAVKVTMPQPIKPSTIYAVVGASAVAIIGSVALWAYFRGKGK